MSILKVILHHWNKTTQSYDNFHPETEVSQVTDWNQGIVNTLASTGLSSLVNVLSSDSLLALLIKKVFDATGVKYSLGQNGYVCLGNFFGGLIIQWGTAKTNSSNRALLVTLPISVNNILIAVASNSDNNDAISTAIAVVDGASLYVHTRDPEAKVYGNDKVSYIVVSI